MTIVSENRAVIVHSGKEYSVTVNDVIKLEKLAGVAGDTLTFDNVLMHGADGAAIVGTPMVSGAVVTGEILEQFRDKKAIAFKKRRRKHSSMTKKAHRQYLTAVRITGIPGGEKYNQYKEKRAALNDLLNMSHEDLLSKVGYSKADKAARKLIEREVD